MGNEFWKKYMLLMYQIHEDGRISFHAVPPDLTAEEETALKIELLRKKRDDVRRFADTEVEEINALIRKIQGVPDDEK